MFPLVLRPLVCLFDPGCIAARKVQASAARIIDPVVAHRRKERQECQAQGISVPAYNDAIEWFETEARAAGVTDCTITDFQLALSFAPISTTSDLLTWTLLWLATDPEGIEALRREMLEVLPAHGWKKTSLYNLKFLDSAIKEAQRLKPSQKVSMLRRATADTRLSDGVIVRKGQIVAVDTYSNLTDPSRYKDPPEVQHLPVPGNARTAQRRTQSATRFDAPRTYGFWVWQIRLSRPFFCRQRDQTGALPAFAQI